MTLLPTLFPIAIATLAIPSPQNLLTNSINEAAQVANPHSSSDPKSTLIRSQTAYLIKACAKVFQIKRLKELLAAVLVRLTFLVCL